MAYMEIIGDKRTINFSLLPKYYAKNSLILAHWMKVPDLELKGNTFINEKILKLTQEKLKKNLKLTKRYQSLIESLISESNELKNVNAVNKFYETLN
ncbi:hypothetical protein B1F79_05190 [Coxiella-like endosymbiont of Rhipicephalus sanguineus]|uniref:hypothetical protein n=1 Tax=Coxiella-like endosymbiont of Rhipicephalus sanguineus TaxID=1955402 RepID=UPI00203D7767|nr:hypothetical protein [Coxiella-like endosymbiont of Rhipicephalus sanguineus]MBT8506796.1 hypothetical protein [Coxiella-like endosymbiont of Rhipicephalus sanguineus]